MATRKTIVNGNPPLLQSRELGGVDKGGEHNNKEFEMWNGVNGQKGGTVYEVEYLIQTSMSSFTVEFNLTVETMNYRV